MKCEEMGERLMDLATGVPPDERLQAHLRTCTACSEHLNQMKQTMALLDRWQAPEPSPYFDVRLQARLREEANRSQQGLLQWFRRPALAAAMAALLVIGGTLYTTGHYAQTNLTQVQPGAAVQDLQALEKNHDLYADFDLLDDMGGNDRAQAMNP